MSTTLNIAHRGGAGLWPENTLAAFARAAAAGFDGAELDVQLSRDGRLVVFHDFRPKPELCRDMRGHWLTKSYPLIAELDFSELRGFDVGRAKPGTAYARTHRNVEPHDGERIPLLSEVIAALRAARKDFRLFVEIKTSFADRALSAAPEAVAEAVLGELRNERFIENTVLVGFDWRAMIHAKRLEPGIACWLTSQRRDLRVLRIPESSWASGFEPSKFKGSLPKAIEAAGADGWFCPHQDATPGAIEEAHRLGLKFGVWTVNHPTRMQKLAGLRVDAICSDRPDKLEAILRRHNPSNSAVER